MNVNLSSVKVERNDTDKAIEQRFHMSVPQIFRELGEETFREAEKETVLDICQGSRAKVIALGGGAYCHDDIRRTCQQCGIVFYLHLSWEAWCRRLPQLREGRPLLQNKSLRDIEALYRRRQAVCLMNTTKVCVDGLTPQAAAEEIVRRLRQRWEDGQ